jgi:NADH-quinone oxidoreductase subunit N
VTLAAYVEGLLYTVLAISLLIPVIPSERRSLHPLMAAIAASLAIIAYGILFVGTAAKGPIGFYHNLVVHDKFTAGLTFSAAIAAAISLLAIEGKATEWPTHPAYYSLFSLILFGLFYLAGSADALVLLASWLLVSVASYIIIALPPDPESKAASVRYILMGAIATIFLALWVGLHAGISMQTFYYKPYTTSGISALAILAVAAALGFKLGVVPFHWWLPSVYGRADGRAVSLVAGVVKLAFIAALTRLVYVISNNIAISDKVAILLALLAVATMTYGNVAALTTRRLQLLLSYSSIAHIGYILVALSALAYFAPRDPKIASLAMGAIAVHSIAYSMSKTPLFSLTYEFKGLKGLLKISPVAAISASILLFSLLGVPPFLGFWGKLYMFLAAVKYSIPLVLVALINSGVSAAYYALAVRDMLSGEPEEEVKEISSGIEAALLAGAIITIVFGAVAPLVLRALSP